jgi:hypothetical protein
MWVKCQPLYDGDKGAKLKGKHIGFCEDDFDDALQWTICPHEPLPTPEEKARFFEEAMISFGYGQLRDGEDK